MATLGTAEEYEAVLVDPLTQEPLVYLPWSKISWSRVRNDVSSARFTVSGEDGGVECCGPIGGLSPWNQMMRIERNGAIVWDGPVTGWSENNGVLDIRAYDRSILTQFRLVGEYIFLENTTPNAVLQALLTAAAIGVPAFDPYTLTVVSGGAEAEVITREYRVERLERVYDCMKEVVDATTTGFFTTIGSEIYLYEAEIRGLCHPSVGESAVLSEQTTSGRPNIDVDGMTMATRGYAGGNGTGVTGFPLVGFSDEFEGVYTPAVLEKASAESRTGNQTDLDLIASRIAAETATPSFTFERIRLNQNFGSDVMPADWSSLIPGIRVVVDFEDTCAFQVPMVEYYEIAGSPFFSSTETIQQARLDELEVSVSRAEGNGLDEIVMGSFRPTTGFIA